MSESLPKLLESSLFNATATPAQIREHCQDAIIQRLACVCVAPQHVPLAYKHLLLDTTVELSTVIGQIRLRLSPIERMRLVHEAFAQGVDELDVFISSPYMLTKQESDVEREVNALCAAAREYGKNLRIRIEAGLLTRKPMRDVCKYARNAGAFAVSVSVSRQSEVDALHNIALIRDAIGPVMRLKVYDPIATCDRVVKFCAAGATRIGTPLAGDVLADIPSCRIITYGEGESSQRDLTAH